MSFIESQPLYDSALQHHQAGRLSETELLCRQILRLDPVHADALHLLGVVAHQTGRHDVAVELIEQAISHNDSNPLYHSNIAASHQLLGRLEEAVASCRRAVELNSTFATAHYNLGRAFQAEGNHAAAEAAYRETLQLDPQHAESRMNLGNLFSERGELHAAVEEFRAAIQCNPHFAYAHYNLGNSLFELGRSEEAIASLQATIKLKPDYAEGYNNLGNVYRSCDRLDEALECFSTACRLQPAHALAHNNCASVFQSQGRLGEAVAAYQTSRQLAPEDVDTHSNLLVAENYLPENTPQLLFEKHRAWTREHTADVIAVRHRCLADPERRLRIGYVSPDFRTHPVAYFFFGLLKQHDRTAVEVTCYNNAKRPDRTTGQIQQLADRWRDVRQWSDARLTEAIVEDEIDILVDLAGHTAGNRLTVFAAKPAPVQVSFLGYPNTTGLESIDYRLTDAIADPPHEQRTYSETLLQLPGPFCCYAPPDLALEISSLPADTSGEITFGSLHNLAKLNAQVIDAWSDILRRVPRSRLLIARSTLTRSCRERLKAEFSQRGIVGQRIELCTLTSAVGSYLSVYSQIDIVLDAFPWGGHTTTCEALWMGVPVLTLRGDRHAGRMGASLLSHMGLQDWIAESREMYVSRAAKLAADTTLLRELRSSLRDRLLASPICDARNYAAEIEAAYRTMWQRYCAVETSFVFDTLGQMS